MYYQKKAYALKVPLSFINNIFVRMFRHAVELNIKVIGFKLLHAFRLVYDQDMCICQVL